MLKSISVSDYKPFENAEIEIRPLTIMLGPNGSGKTAILRFLMMLHQTSQFFDQSSKGSFALNGQYVELGEAEKIVKGGKKRQSWQFSIGLEQRQVREAFNGSLEYVIAGIQRSVDRILYYVDMRFRRADNKNEDLEDAYREVRTRFASRIRRKQKTNIQKFLEISELYIELDDFLKSLGQNFMDFEIEEEDLSIFDYRFIRQRSGPSQIKRFIQPDNISPTEISGLRNLLSGINEAGFANCKVTIELKKMKGATHFFVDKISVTNPRNIITLDLSVEKDKYTVNAVGSDFAPNSDIDKYHKVLEKSLRLDRTFFQLFEYHRASDNLTPLFVSSFISKLISEIEDEIDSADFVHIPPIRPFLERYITNSAKSGETIGTGASDLLDYLSKPDVKKYVDGWFEEFEIEFKVNQITELLREIVVLQKVAGLELSLKDVGFGYSQVLPIIIESVARPAESLTLIEQPEVHLHPRMQAKMADFFIECSGIRSDQRKDKRRNFVVETHSENFLKRLRRRIAEGSVQPTDVAIYFFEKSSEEGNLCTQIKRVDISSSGDIDWPSDFYATDLEDTKAFMKASAVRWQRYLTEGEDGQSGRLRIST